MEANWAPLSRSDAAQLLDALHDPPDGNPRIPETYGHTTAPQDFLIDEPGLTDVFTVAYVRDGLLSE